MTEPPAQLPAPNPAHDAAVDPAERGSTDRASQRRDRQRAELDVMVARVLDPAVGLCLRALDRRGEDLDNARAEAREIVKAALRSVAARGVGDDDRTVHRVMRRTAEVALDALIGRDLVVPLPRDVDLDDLLGEVSVEQVAPGGRLDLAALQDAVAACRSADRQVAYVVLAAGLPPGDAATLLGRRESELRTSLRRVARRLGEIHLGVVS